ncbi:MAG: Glu-tRNA(Gln) amidotransferase subunit GatD [Thermoprotei archaeon]
MGGYPEDVVQLLRSAGVSVWDRIRIKKDDQVIEGILMPRPALLGGRALVVKLDNGYNVGVLPDGAQIELISKGAEPEISAGEEPKELPKKGLRNVTIVSAGGTISSRIDYNTGAVFPALTARELSSFFPGIMQLANIRSVPLLNILSEDMSPSHWKLLAQTVYNEISDGADGVVITHGTDTLHYTASALSFMLQGLGVPVALVGAQRSSDRGSSDNVMNLECSVAVAASDMAGVVVVMHGSMSDDYCLVHQGVKVRKMHTSRRDAFRSINVLPYARVRWKGDSSKPIVERIRDYPKRSEGKPKLDLQLDDRVALIYVHPGINPEFIASLSKYYDGVVLAGTGLGHASTNPGSDPLAKSILPSIRSLINSGIPVVMAPQTIYGRVNMNVYAAGRLLKEAGVIGDQCDWTPEAALVKLMFVLGHTKDMKEVKRLMETDMVGEISPTSDPRAFLYRSA